jgi:DNA primase catalytic core
MAQVDEVRAAADIVKVVGDYVKLRKAGANFMGLCPFHQEKTPSFAVHPTKQIFHCFGCGVGGDVFKFVMLIENLSFPEALRRVAEKVGVPLREVFRDEISDANARERAALYKEAIDKMVLERRNLIYIYHQNYIVAYPKNLKNYKAVPDGLIRLKGVSWN